MFSLSHMGFVKNEYNHLYYLLFSIFSLGLNVKDIELKINNCKKDIVGKFGLLFFLFYIVLVNGIPDMHHDSLWYHLSGPRQWFNNGIPFFNKNDIGIMACYFWEYIYLIPNLLLSTSIENGMISIHIFSQWIIGVICFPLALSYLKKLGDILIKDFCHLDTCVFLSIFSFGVFNTIQTAKNDWAVLCYCLSGMYYFLKSKNNNVDYCLGTILLSAALISKISYSFFIIPFLTLQIFNNWKRVKTIPYILIFMILPVSILIRNYSWTTNPFYPAMGSLFDYRFFTETWVKALVHYEVLGFNLKLAHIKNKYSEIFQLRRVFTFIIFVPLFMCCKKEYYKENKNLIHFIILILFSSLIFIIKIGPLSEMRHLAIVVVLVSFLSISLIYVYLEQIKLKNYSITIFSIIFLVYYVNMHDFQFEKVTYLLKNKNFNYFISRFPGGYCNLWLRENLKDNQKILSLNDSRNYYFLDLNFIRVGDSIEQSKYLYLQKEIKDKLEKYKKNNFDVLLETSDPIDKFYSKNFEKELATYLKNNPDKILFQTKTCRVITTS